MQTRSQKSSSKSPWRPIHFVFLLLTLTAGGSGQSLPVPVAVGYATPNPVLAPGLLTTLYVYGLNPQGPSFSAQSLPLPTTLGPISVSVSSQASGLSAFAPLLSVGPTPENPLITAITIEVPTSIFPGVLAQLGGTVLVTVNGTAGQQMPVSYSQSSVHVIQRCTLVIAETSTQPLQSCSVVALHANGTAVTTSSPAKPGEHIVIYAFGLGKTISPVTDGAAAAQPSPALGPIWLDFDYSPGASPRQFPPLGNGYTPDYAGLAPGYVGLYQINFTIPSTVPAGTPACGTGPYTNNLTITLHAPGSYDGGSICVNVG